LAPRVQLYGCEQTVRCASTLARLVTPEPAALVLFGAGMVGISILGRKKVLATAKAVQ